MDSLDITSCLSGCWTCCPDLDKTPLVETIHSWTSLESYVMTFENPFIYFPFNAPGRKETNGLVE